MNTIKKCKDFYELPKFGIAMTGLLQLLSSVISKFEQNNLYKNLQCFPYLFGRSCQSSADENF